MRTVKVLTTSGIVQELRTSAQTWGQLKQELTTNLENRKVLVGSTKAELSVDEAVLPAGDFRLYLVESKVKSGALDKKELQNYLKLVDITTEILKKATELLINELKKSSSEDKGKIDLKTLFEKMTETTRKESPEDLAAIEEIKKLQGEVSEENSLDDEDEDDDKDLFDALSW